MKKIFLLILTCALIACNSSGQSVKKVEPVKKSTATKNESGDLVGTADKTTFMQEPYNTWFDSGYENYNVDLSITNKIKDNLEGITVKGFIGTWCGDSKREIPHFYKIADEVGLEINDIDLVTVNRSKRTPDNLQEGFNVLRVPTFIFYRNGEEIGRFVEYPRETLEKDILKIVSGEDYKHSYEK
jgi:thiol-disulfide isomerase/thioredoxin